MSDIIYFKRKKTKRKKQNKSKKFGGHKIELDETPSFFSEKFNTIKYLKYQDHKEHI